MCGMYFQQKGQVDGGCVGITPPDTGKRDKCVCPEASMCAFVIAAYLIVF